jgi:hypothetical protein
MARSESESLMNLMTVFLWIRQPARVAAAQQILGVTVGVTLVQYQRLRTGINKPRFLRHFFHAGHGIRFEKITLSIVRTK